MVFVPKSGKILATFPLAIAGNVVGYEALSCVSVNQCTAVSDAGAELSFNPSTGKTISNSSEPNRGRGFGAVACSSPTACTAFLLDGTGTLQGFEVTFDPTSGAPNAAGLALVGGMGLNELSCPSATQCTAVDSDGAEITFNPTTGQPTGAGQVTLWLGTGFQMVSCPSVSQCTAGWVYANVITFNPGTGTRNSAGLHRFRPAVWVAIDCPSVTQCTIVGSLGDEATFNRQGIGNVYTIDH